MKPDEVFQREIEELLRRRIGLNSEALGARTISRAVKRGLRQSRLKNLADYCAELKTSAALFDELVEMVVVPETSFFRNRVSYGFLRQWVSEEWRPQMDGSKTRPLRVLSLPCSTGEEPYSIAITLLENNLALSDFHIDAVDVSAVALAKAQAGIFSPYAFRRRTYRKDDKYFSLAVPTDETESGFKRCNSADLAVDLGSELSRRKPLRYVLNDDVRNKISFYQGNVLDEGLLADALPYDIVFCRNMLIYFDRIARDRAFSLLNRVLRPGGLLFVGYAETRLVSAEHYRSVPYPQTFAFYKRSAVGKAATKATAQPYLAAQHKIERNKIISSPVVEKPHAFASGLQAALPIVKIINSATAGREAQRQTDLDLARELADKNSLAQATELCDRYLAAHPSSAAAHLLKGELYQALGDMDAAEGCFGCALYLSPQMHEALTHLLIIHEGRGEMDKAGVVRSRLQRLDGAL